MNGERLSLAARLIRHVVLLCGSVVMLGPFIWMVATSLKPKDEIFSSRFHLLPQGSWGAAENYWTALTQVPLLHFLLNGALVTSAIFLLQVLVNVPAAYALAKLRFRGRGLRFGAVLLCLVIPYQAVALPIFILFFALGLLNTYAALVFPFTISVFGIFLMRQFFMTVPDDLIDAARIDGMSEHVVAFDDVTLQVTSHGPSDGALAVLLHGFPDTALTFRHLAPHLADLGYRVIVPSMRGYAPSSIASSQDYSVAALATDANRLHEYFGGDERALLVGHDWGSAAVYPALVARCRHVCPSLGGDDERVHVL